MTLPDCSDPETRAAAVRAASARRVEPKVLETLTVTTEAQRRSKRALSEGVAVVTGQQAGLFGGPLYTLHKAAAAIVNARALEQQTGVPAAPVFWLQDEDHDFAEIASTHLLDGDLDLHRAHVDGLPSEEGASVAHRTLGPSVSTALQTASTALEGLPHAEQVLTLLEHCYQPQRTISAAFHDLMQTLFAEHGLLVVDPMHPDLAKVAEPVHVRAREQAGSLARALLDHGAELQASGHPVPVHVREQAPLSFVHPQGRSGPRHRFEPAGTGYRLVGSDETLSEARLSASFHTTSALLRPILQDTWLPTAAYVGGPGELAYLAQCEPLWKAFDLPVPLVVLRARFALIDPSTRRALDALALSLADLETPREALLARLGQARGELPPPDELLADLTEHTQARLQAFRPPASRLSDGLGKSVDKTAAHLQATVEKLVDRYRKALARDDQVLLDRVDRVRAMLRPLDAPQERVLGFASFAARVGTANLVQTVLDAVLPFHGDLEEVML